MLRLDGVSIVIIFANLGMHFLCVSVQKFLASRCLTRQREALNYFLNTLLLKAIIRTENWRKGIKHIQIINNMCDALQA